MAGSCRILGSCDVPVVARSVLEEEVTVHDLAVGEHSETLVVVFLFVDKLMTSKTINACHVAPNESE